MNKLWLLFRTIHSAAPNPRLAALALRMGLAFVFAYAALDSLAHPGDWVGYLPHTLDKFVSMYTLLQVISVYQLLLVGWLLVGKYVRLAAFLSALTLAGITSVNLGVFAITFRDVGLVLAAVALIFLGKVETVAPAPASQFGVKRE